MNSNQIKLIVTDMDGTLVKSNHELPDDFFSVFEMLKQKGILFCVASGRQYYNLREQMLPIKDEIYFAAENGSLLMHKEEEQQINDLPFDTVLELLEIGRKVPNTYTLFCGRKSCYVESDAPELMAQLKKYYHKFEVVDDLSKVDDKILKFTICDLNGAEKYTLPYFEQYKNEMNVKVAGAMWLDISAPDANKGKAIETLQKLHNISPEETMVFGDYLNDLEMMSCAYFSYAMENAHEELKQAARFITKSNDNDGVLEVIRREVLELPESKV
ncbi:HAD family hydrolase [Limibacter armeniacum]|uniref:HAD family hydrolase n=1 Tax=Limibacter armeniacum TaxID=466084 RepID=UPI002FE50C2A